MSIVFKYANRRYYMPRVGYLTLKRLSELPGIMVIDHKTKNDITQKTLLKAKYLKEAEAIL